MSQMEALRILWNLNYFSAKISFKCAGAHLYTWMEKGPVRVKNTTYFPWAPGLELGPLEP